MPAPSSPQPTRGTVCLTFDNMGRAVDVFRGRRCTPDPDEVGLRLGYPRILAMLKNLGMHATFFIEGWSVLHYPARVREVVDAGHEVAAHGWIHEVFADLDKDQARRVLVDALASYRNLGFDPVGFRAPGGHRGIGNEALLSELGFQYDSSVADDGMQTPMVPRLLTPTLMNVPWRRPMIDNYHYAPVRQDRQGGAISPAELAALWIDMVDDAAANGTLVTFIAHAHVSGPHADRLDALERVLDHARNHAGIDVVTAREVASRALAQAPRTH